LSVSYEESDYELGVYYYLFSIDAQANAIVEERSAICFADYVLEDGTTGTASFVVYQEANGGITYNGNNPLLFESGDYNTESSPSIRYAKGSGISVRNTIQTPSVIGDFTAVGTSFTISGADLVIEYDIAPKYYNVYKEDKVGSVAFSYTNEGLNNSYVLHINQKGAVYPFGFMNTDGSALANKDRIEIPYTESVYEITCNYPYSQRLNTFDVIGGDDVDVKTSTGGRTDGTLYQTLIVKFNENKGVYPRVVEIVTTYTSGDGVEHRDSVKFIQAANKAEYVGQIWRDIEYNFGTQDMVEYSIYKDGTPIFFSRTNKRPSAETNTILVNKICQNYIDIPYLISEVEVADGNYAEFQIKSIDGSVTYGSYRFVNDWSYEDDFRTGVLSHPILNDYKMVYYGQWLPFSIFATDKLSIPYGIRYNEGDDWIVRKDVVDGIANVNFPNLNRNDKDKVVGYMIDDVEYNVVDDCNVEYVLYYINPWGGYDWFPIRGKVVEKDSLTQFTYTQNCNNTKLDFQKNRYLAEIHKRFTLNTHWLKEDESRRMWYLLESNVVYLHNIRENKVHPVLITNTDVEYKQRGKKSSRISYQIEVELSQTRERL
jgi:hypothetical protein